MSKPYIRKHFDTIDQLETERGILREKTKELQTNWWSDLISPQTGLFLITAFLGRRSKKGRPGNASSFFKPKGKASFLTGTLPGWGKRFIIRKAGRFIGMPFLKWQIVSLLFFLLKKGIKRLKNKRR